VTVRLQAPEVERLQRSLDRQREQRFWLAAAVTGIVTGTIVLISASLPAVGWSLLAAGVLAGFISLR
jgi:hypothetical protein